MFKENVPEIHVKSHAVHDLYQAIDALRRLDSSNARMIFPRGDSFDFARKVNGDGSQGGFVSANSRVDAKVYTAKTAVVAEKSVLSGNAKILDNATVVKSEVLDNATISHSGVLYRSIAKNDAVVEGKAINYNLISGNGAVMADATLEIFTWVAGNAKVTARDKDLAGRWLFGNGTVTGQEIIDRLTYTIRKTRDIETGMQHSDKETESAIKRSFESVYRNSKMLTAGEIDGCKRLEFDFKYRRRPENEGKTGQAEQKQDTSKRDKILEEKRQRDQRMSDMGYQKKGGSWHLT